MINIRSNVFETNSSNVHNLVLLNDRDYGLWKNGNLYIDFIHDTVYHEDELPRERFEHFGILSIVDYNDWVEDYDLIDELQYVDGQPIHAIGYYGRS